MDTINVPSGFVVAIFGNAKGALTAKNGKTGERTTIYDLQIPVPLPGTVEEAMGELTYELTDINGNVYEYTGLEAAGMRVWFHAAENLRGLFRPGRKGGVLSEEQVRARGAAFTSLTGRERGGRRVTVSSDRFDALTEQSGGDIEKLKQLLAAEGVVG